MRRHKGIYLLPNLLTTGNLFCGFFAIISVLNAEYVIASIAILVAALFDSLDGQTARYAKVTSPFGVEYDSLSDLVSFGVAPGLLIYSWALNSFGRIGWVAAFLFVVCGALRLARFNVQASTVENKQFMGLPTPAAAGMIASTVILDYHILPLGKEIRPFLILTITYLLAFLMVSHLRYRSLKSLSFRERKPFHVLVASVLIFIVFAAIPQVMLFTLFALYDLSGIFERPVSVLLSQVSRRANRAKKAREVIDPLGPE